MMDRNALYVISGENPFQMTLELLRHIKPLEGLRKDIRIGIKPNLVCAKPASEGATTHPEIVEGILVYLKEEGYRDIRILEGSWVGDRTERAFRVCGYSDLSKAYQVPLVDLQRDGWTLRTVKGMALKVCNEALEVEYLINVPLIKGHCQTKITCALKNMKGLIPDEEKRRYHTMGLHKPIALLNAVLRQDLIVADAICPDPYFEEGGSPVPMNRIVAGADPVLMDSYAASLLGYQPEEIPYILLAEELGIGQRLRDEKQIRTVGHPPMDEDAGIRIDRKERKYLRLIEEADACSACMSNLVAAMEILHEQGFIETFADQICIGQAYRRYQGELGVGDCTACFRHHVPGCPPDIGRIVRDLKRMKE